MSLVEKLKKQLEKAKKDTSNEGKELITELEGMIIEAEKITKSNKDNSEENAKRRKNEEALQAQIDKLTNKKVNSPKDDTPKDDDAMTDVEKMAKAVSEQFKDKFDKIDQFIGAVTDNNTANQRIELTKILSDVVKHSNYIKAQENLNIKIDDNSNIAEVVNSLKPEQVASDLGELQKYSKMGYFNKQTFNTDQIGSQGERFSDDVMENINNATTLAELEKAAGTGMVNPNSAMVI